MHRGVRHSAENVVACGPEPMTQIDPVASRTPGAAGMPKTLLTSLAVGPVNAERNLQRQIV